jgi:hypothetical protein
MAVSKELKEYINRKYDERISAIVERINSNKSKALELARKTAERELQERAEDLVESLQFLINELVEEDEYTTTYDGRDFLERGIKNLIQVKVAHRETELEILLKKEIEDLKKEKELLLITISLEKNFDKINSLLSQYGIGL